MSTLTRSLVSTWLIGILLQPDFQDLLRVVISIQEGKVLPSMLLRKLTTYSRKNRLYQAFHALGTVVRTAFLLTFISDVKLREVIHRSTNKVEQYNAFEDWITFAGAETIYERAYVEAEKRVKYTGIIANCVMLDNTVEISNALNTLAKEGMVPTIDELAALSPYQTRHIKRLVEQVLRTHKHPWGSFFAFKNNICVAYLLPLSKRLSNSTSCCLQHDVELLLSQARWQLHALVIHRLHETFAHFKTARGTTHNEVLAGTELVQEENSLFANAKQWIAADLVERVAKHSASLVDGDTGGGTLGEMMRVQEHLANQEGEIGGGGTILPAGWGLALYALDGGESPLDREIQSRSLF